MKCIQLRVAGQDGLLGKFWGRRDSRQGIFHLAVADRFLLITELLLRDAHAAKGALLCNGDSMLL